MAYSPKSQPIVAELGLQEGATIPVERTGLSACTQGEIIIMPDTAQIQAPLPQTLAQNGIRSLMGIPLIVENETFGILSVARKATNGFTSTDEEFLRMLSEHVALAAHQIKLHQDLKNAYDELRQTQQAAM